MQTNVLPFVSITGPKCMCFDPTDNNIMYCSTRPDNSIYKINITTKETSVYLTGFDDPNGIVFDNNQNLYCANYGSGIITKTTPGKITTTFASGINNPFGLCFDNENQLFYCSSINGSQIYKIEMNGNVSLYASGAPLSFPFGITLDPETKAIYAANLTGSGVTKTIKENTNNTSTTLYGTVSGSRAVAYKNDIVYCSTVGDTIYEISNGIVEPFVSSSLISDTYHIINGPIENNRIPLYVTNYTYNSIVKIFPSDKIEVNPLFSKVLGSSAFSLNATSTSTSQIYYTSSNTNVADVGLESGIVTIEGVGACDITLTQYFEGQVSATASTTIEVSSYILSKDIESNFAYVGIALDTKNPNIMYALNNSFGLVEKINLLTKTVDQYLGIEGVPNGITLDNDNNIYVVSGFNTIHKFITPNNSSIIAQNLPTATGLCFDSLEEQIYCACNEKIIKIDMNGNINTYSTNYFHQFLGITIDEFTKDIYVNTSSAVLKVIINSDTGNTTITKLADIPNARDITFVNGVIYCSTSDNIAYQIVPGELSAVVDWISSPLLSNSFSIINGPNYDDNVYTFYISTSGNGILKIIDGRDIYITSVINVNSVFNKLFGDPNDSNFNMGAISSNPSTITYLSSNTNVAEVGLTTGDVTIKGTGSCQITMTQNAYHDAYINNNVFYSDCSAVSTINVSSPTITVVPLINKILTDSQFNIIATSNSTLQIYYESSNSNVVVVDSTTGEVTIVGVGTAIITSKQLFNGVIISSATTTINIYSNEPFGNVTAMNYDTNKGLLYICSSNEYPYNFITIDNSGNTTSLNIPTVNANIKCINTDSNIYVGGTFNSLSGNQRNVNISELINEDISYSTIELSVNNTFVESVENNQTIGIITTDNGTPFEISKK